jgi:hypothetical protein
VRASRTYRDLPVSDDAAIEQALSRVRDAALQLLNELEPVCPAGVQEADRQELVRCSERVVYTAYARLHQALAELAERVDQASWVRLPDPNWPCESED